MSTEEKLERERASFWSAAWSALYSIACATDMPRGGRRYAIHRHEKAAADRFRRSLRST